MLSIEIQKKNHSFDLEPLYKQLLEETFSSETIAIEFCQNLCLQYGFPVRQKSNANQIIYLYCSYEQQPTSPLKKRRSSTILGGTEKECQWHVMLHKNKFSEWIFKRTDNSNTAEHNHQLPLSSSSTNISNLEALSDDINDEFDLPFQIKEQINMLLHQNEDIQIDEVQQQLQFFPNITWDSSNNRQFYNYMIKMKKKIKEEKITKRIQRLILTSTQLCSVIASNEAWTTCIAGDLSAMIEDYQQMLGISEQELNEMVGLRSNLIHSESDIKAVANANSRSANSNQPSVEKEVYNKKRILETENSVCNDKNSASLMLSVPSCTLYVRSQPLRTLLNSSTATVVKAEPQYSPFLHNSRRPHVTSSALLPVNSAISNNQQQLMVNTSTTHFNISPSAENSSSVFSMSSPIISPSQNSSIQQRIAYHNYQMNTAHQSANRPPSPPVPNPANNNNDSCNGNDNDIQQQSNYDSASMYSLQPAPYLPSHNMNAPTTHNSNNANELGFSFESNSHQHTIPYSYQDHSSNNMARCSQQGIQPSPLSASNYVPVNYYTSSKDHNAAISRSNNYHSMSPMNTNSMQQRILQQQHEYEHHLESSVPEHTDSNTNEAFVKTGISAASNANSNIQLPVIRTNHRQHQFLNSASSNWT
ncbi:MAG: hypothetical protein EXX96DRAFT_576953 [Benjaminiella poitrasii]|nr:MAG: hypothetical protein EXX96DRAFT_576953 [Benjaminiella poitrasii]